MMRRVRPDERGTSMLIVLMIITFVSVVMGVVLSQEGTSLKTTGVVQDVSATHYGADAAGQAAVTQLTNGQFACASTGASTLTLGSGPSNPFYNPVGTDAGPLNATATCSPDTTTGVTTTTTGTGTMVSAANTPSATITTVGTTPVVDGIFSLDLLTLCVQGSVVSYTSISGTVSAGVNSGGSATACPNATSPAVTMQAAAGCLNIAGPTACTALGPTTPPVPTVPDPGAPISTPSQPVCSSGNTYAAFMPGLYTTSTSSTGWSLSTPCANGKKWVAPSVADWFSPGVYYFDFGATTWTLPSALVGGTPATASGSPIAGLNPAVASTLSALSQMPSGEGKCIPPTAQTQAGEGGVEFVFGGASTMTGMNPPTLFTVPVGPSTDMDICATYSATSPPVAIYGVYQKPLTEAGGPPISAESGCVATPGCILPTRSILNWPVVGPLTLPLFGVDQTFHIDGYVWAPAAALEIGFATAKGQAFNWGILTRTFQMIGITLFSPVTLARVPAPNAGQVTTSTYSVRYVNVWTCAASANPCPQTGPPDVQIKLQQTGTTWKVLSWSERR